MKTFALLLAFVIATRIRAARSASAVVPARRKVSGGGNFFEALSDRVMMSSAPTEVPVLSVSYDQDGSQSVYYTGVKGNDDVRIKRADTAMQIISGGVSMKFYNVRYVYIDLNNGAPRKTDRVTITGFTTFYGFNDRMIVVNAYNSQSITRIANSDNGDLQVNFGLAQGFVVDTTDTWYGVGTKQYSAGPGGLKIVSSSPITANNNGPGLLDVKLTGQDYLSKFSVFNGGSFKLRSVGQNELFLGEAKVDVVTASYTTVHAYDPSKLTGSISLNASYDTIYTGNPADLLSNLNLRIVGVQYIGPEPVWNGNGIG